MEKKKFKRFLSFLLAVVVLMFYTSMPAFAKDYNTGKARLDHIDVYVNGTISIYTQINGVTQEIKTGNLKISNLSATVVDGGNTSTYTNFSTQTQAGSKELEFHKRTSRYSTSATITVTGRMICSELGINTTFSKQISGDSLLEANKECPAHTGCDIRITKDEINNTITHKVTFKTEDGGTIDGNTEAIIYTGIIDGSSFPNVPTTKANTHYEFAGWYDTSENKITKFPSTVTEDMVFIAKWNKVATDPEPITPIVAKYYVKHYLEQEDGTYEEVTADAQLLTGKIGETVTGKPNAYENYTYNADKSTTTGEVFVPNVVEGKLNILTLKLYYDISEVEYTVEYYLQDSAKSTNYTLKEKTTDVAKIGQSITAKTKTFDGYVFNESKSNVKGTVSANGLVLKLYYDLNVADEETIIPDNKPIITPKKKTITTPKKKTITPSDTIDKPSVIKKYVPHTGENNVIEIVILIVILSAIGLVATRKKLFIKG